MYKVVKYFEDLQDNRHPYNEGDTFPKEGMEVSAERIEELATTANRRKIVLIEEVAEKKKARPKKAELLAEAEALGIEVPDGATNPEIHKLIEEAK